MLTSVVAIGFAVAPNIVVAVIFNCVISATLAIVGPGILVALSLAIPARARATGFSVASLWVIPGLVILPFMIWQLFSKCPSVEITNEFITLNGLKIDRQNVLEWRIFRTSSNGERGRYIELKLARFPNDTLRWKLAKLFEQVAPSMRFDRKMRLAKEPRIIVSLNRWDLKESEIARALENAGMWDEAHGFYYDAVRLPDCKAAPGY